MSNSHLVPINVLDIIDRLNSNNIRENEKANYILRLEATRDVITKALNEIKKPAFHVIKGSK